MNWNQIYICCLWTTIALTIIIQLLTVAKLIRSGKYYAFVKITSMFLLSNVAGFMGLIAYSEYEKNTTNHVWLGLYSFSLAINWGL